MYRKRNTNYQKILLEQKKKIFSTADLGVLWGIENENTLWMTIQRYLKRNILYSIQKGLYSVVTLDKLDAFELACSVAGSSSYISGETVLQKAGLMVQNLDKITLFGVKTKQFSLGGRKFLCRYLNPKYLYNRNGIVEKNTYSIASVDRAVLDLLHVNPKYYFDNHKILNKSELKLLKRKVGYK